MSYERKTSQESWSKTTNSASEGLRSASGVLVNAIGALMWKSAHWQKEYL
jgi:hypothetical protein